ncbi:LLM class flavin-dependent oxidoreductase [Natronosporangium hydrolyticum]|uniref:LLM class flavin-dependent oxidoreductase n=1 Tax=Natronosporangium hydrolyticum TaxID=2811111 RepID=A0A895YEY0_9ACTN|nr:LLM class flavin-dependent oxidoreductase [Natronosporangium hydrolyticum]QSB13969.1 LLM class flavin-dependent oxidoreductase [Natronosporangium hydrolyticum]
MTDYGHELQFGSFLTPSARQPEQVVALARASEAAGLDLVTFQDHPYQPAFLDSWTLLSYVAAATDRIRLSGNVLNLPLRQPTVLARSAASLDRLTGGRVELALGAGGFWDAIEANGGPRRQPGEAVAALREAIEIIREVWDVDQRGGARVIGEHYRVAGAKRGPAPAHDMEIWVGAYGPRMLRLVGEFADGWLPSLPFLKRGAAELPELNARIDEAATAAGRAPAAIRRLLNLSGEFTDSDSGLLSGPPTAWAEQLTELALTAGVSGFVLMTDDPTTIARFGAEVAPAVREAVAAERGRPRGSVGADLAAGAAAGADAPADEGTPVWDETTRPVAPPAPEGHAYTERGHAIGQHLVDVHDHLRQELKQLRDLLRQVRRGALSPAVARSQINQLTMRQHTWALGAYCASYCTLLAQHHGLEDQSVFPHLRTSDTGLAPVLDRLEEEHVVIHELSERVDRALVDLINKPDDFDPLQAAVDQLADALTSHLGYEEDQLVEPLSRYGMAPGQLA